MKETFKRWLSENAKTRGVIACGVRFVDRECVSQTRSGGLTADQLRDIWHSLAEASSHLAAKSATGQTQQWSFENARIRIALRTDGVMFGVISDANSGDGELSELLESFLEFKPAA